MQPPEDETIALFPLHAVLFPGGLLPLQIFEARYVDLVRDCLRMNQGFGVVPIKEGREAGVGAIPFLVGTYAEIADWSQGSNGLLNILARGTRRFRIQSHSVAPNQLMTAQVEWSSAPKVLADSERYVELRALLNRLLQHKHAIEQASSLGRLSNAEIAYRIAEVLPITSTQKVDLLSHDDDLTLLTAMETFLSQLLSPRSNKH